MKGHFTKVNVTPKKHLREFRVDSIDEVKVGDELKADVFAAGEKSISKELQKVKDSKVLLNVMDNQEDLWDMVLCIIEDQDQWDLHQLQVEFSKVKNYQDIWEFKQLQFKT